MHSNAKLNLIHLVYMYEEDLALKNLELLICLKTIPDQTKLNQTRNTINPDRLTCRKINQPTNQSNKIRKLNC